MKQIIKLSYLIGFIMGGTPLGDLVQIACARKAEDLNPTWVSEELHNIRPTDEDIENIHQYLETLKQITTEISYQENEYKFLHLQALDHLQSYCANLILDKNKEKILFLQKLLDVIKSNKSSKIEGIIFYFIYSPGAHFFANQNVGVFIERLLIEGTLSQDDLRIMSSFIISNIDELNRSLKTFISYEQPC
jgi:hypothetical protein